MSVLSTVLYSQPLSSAKEMGVPLRYWVEVGLTGHFLSDSYEDKVLDFEASEDIDLKAGRVYLPKIKQSKGYSLGLGAEIEKRHEIAFHYNSYQVESKYEGETLTLDMFDLNVDYRFLFFRKNGLKPYVEGGFFFGSETLKNGYKIKNSRSTHDARFVGRGLVAGTGVAYVARYVGITLGLEYSYRNSNRVAIEEGGYELLPNWRWQGAGVVGAVRLYF